MRIHKTMMQRKLMLEKKKSLTKFLQNKKKLNVYYYKNKTFK